MMTVSNFMEYLKTVYPDYVFYNGTIDKNNKNCIGIYLKGRGDLHIAIVALSNTSYSLLPVSILIHWGQDASLCEITANGIYEGFQTASDVTINNQRVIYFDLADPTPTDISRDENGICEMVIRLNILYER